MEKDQIEKMAKERNEIKDIMTLLDKCTSLNPMYKAEVATVIYGNNYRKLSEDSVVLSREELNEKYVLIDTLVQCKEELEFIKRQKNKLETRIAIKENDIGKLESEIDDLKYELKQASKETAEKIFKMLINELESNKFLYGKRIIMEVDVENLAKQFGLEVEE